MLKMNEKLEKAKKLRAEGKTLQTIANELGISKVMVFNLLKQDKIELLINKVNELEKRIKAVEEKLDIRKIAQTKDKGEEKRDPGLMNYDKNLGIFSWI